MWTATAVVKNSSGDGGGKRFEFNAKHAAKAAKAAQNVEYIAVVANVVVEN
jgi:hypothetical protein